jgi:kynurenine formamidase
MPISERDNWPNVQTGITKDVVPWVRDTQVAAIAADNLGVEQAPNADGKNWNLHGNLLRDLGVFLGELWWLEDLAADCAQDGRYEFFLTAAPLYIPGAVGSPLNPMGIK